MTDTPTPAVACRLDAIAPPERRRHAELLAELRAAVEEVRELPDGLAFRFADEGAAVLEEWLPLEKLCCPFLDLSRDGAAPSWLRVTGPEGAKEFLRSELDPSKFRLASGTTVLSATVERRASTSLPSPPATAGGEEG